MIITWADALRATCLYGSGGDSKTGATSVLIGSQDISTTKVAGAGTGDGEETTLLGWYKDAHKVDVYNQQSGDDSSTNKWESLGSAMKVRIVLARPFSAPLSPHSRTVLCGAHPRRVPSSQSST